MRAYSYDPNSGITTVLEIQAADLEELIARCGWTITNGLDAMTDADHAELERLRKLDSVGLPSRSTDDHRAWWRERVIGELHPATA